MRLTLFRSLIKRTHGQSSISLRKEISKITGLFSPFQGIELCSSQIDETTLSLCRSHNLQVICRIIPDDRDDACRRLEQLSTHLMKSCTTTTDSADVIPVVRLVILDQPFAAISDDDGIQYLSHVLPMAAQFMESHPTIGRSKGELNAHGKPLDTHVLGVCHRLQTSGLEQVASGSAEASSEMLQYFCNILDVLPPTRLSWNFQNEGAFRIDEPLPLDKEPLIQCVDHFDFSIVNDASKFLQSKRFAIETQR